jgi:twitching motility protein PilT
MIAIEELLAVMVQRGGSDLHISAGTAPKIRVDGVLVDTEHDIMVPETTQSLVYSFLSSDQVAAFERDLELDLSFGIDGLGRFRVNVFLQRGTVAAVVRVIPYEICGFGELGLPIDICTSLCALPKGLILVTGSTGSGKSTTLASMIDHINQTRSGHIVTIEDPIEFLHRNKSSLCNQREIGGDTHEFKVALRSVLRQDPDVVMIGELRDRDTVEAALTIAETGHLTFATLHTSDAVTTINRIIDIFPSYQQSQVRTQLSFVLQAVFAQHLLPHASGRGRVLGVEVLLCTPAVRAMMREDKIHQVYSLLQTGGKLGMRTMNQSLFRLNKTGLVAYEDCMQASTDPEDLKRLFQRMRA